MSRILFCIFGILILASIACGEGEAKVADTSTATPSLGPTSTSTVETASSPTPSPTPTPIPAPTLSPTPPPTPTPVLGVELAVNGSFEDGVSDAEGWIFYASGDRQDIQLMTEGAHTGQRAIKITSANTDRPSPEINSTPLLVLEKGKRYQLSAYVRTDQQASFSIGMSWYQDDGVTRAFAVSKEYKNFEHTEWTRIFHTSDTSQSSIYKDASLGYIYVHNHNQASVNPSEVKEFTLYLDDVSLREIIE